MTAAEILQVAQVWGDIGAAVALVFLTIGIDRIDEDARGAYVFRPLIAPGVVLLWPLVLWRWWVLETGRDVWRLRHLPPRASHGQVWMVIGAIIVLTFVFAVISRQVWPADIAPVRLDG